MLDISEIIEYSEQRNGIIEHSEHRKASKLSLLFMIRLLHHHLVDRLSHQG
jgi:hypothetical protein